jgi:hypothetical protein
MLIAAEALLAGKALKKNISMFIFATCLLRSFDLSRFDKKQTQPSKVRLNFDPA